MENLKEEKKEVPELTMEQIEQLGSTFVNFMRTEYDVLKKQYHSDDNIKKMMDLPSYCFTMFVIAIKSYNTEQSI